MVGAAMVLNGLGFMNSRLSMTTHFFQDKPVAQLLNASDKTSFHETVKKYSSSNQHQMDRGQRIVTKVVEVLFCINLSLDRQTFQNLSILRVFNNMMDGHIEEKNGIPCKKSPTHQPLAISDLRQYLA